MEFFDCNCWYGVPSVPPLRPALRVEDLLAEMEWTGVTRALVRHAAMDNEAAEVGNRLIAEETAPHPALHPSWAILPPQTDELGTPEEFLQAMGQAGVRALWAFPSKHRYSLNATTFGPLFRLLEERRVPLFLERGETNCGDLASAVLRDFPRLVMVVVGHGSWGEDRYFRPLVEAYEGFHVDTSRYELDGGIADFCRKYGPERLLFGSAFPHTSAGGAMLTLAHADITDEEKRKIAAGNLDRLLAEVRL